MERWEDLSPQQQRAWTGFLTTHAAIVEVLDAELRAAHGLPLAWFDVLIHLSRAPRGELRMATLARATRFSRGGLTHLVERLERDELLHRREGGTYPRTVYACITQRGRDRLRAALPTHLEGIRRLYLDRLSPEQLTQLCGVWDRLDHPSAEP